MGEVAAEIGMNGLLQNSRPLVDAEATLRTPPAIVFLKAPKRGCKAR